ncbi:MAG: hypothetical protein H7240_11875 [Glaciimonas sp.]|nr:hypothetical protein [Glaciimonas sp.]
MNHTLDPGIPLLTEIIVPLELAPFDEMWLATKATKIDNDDSNINNSSDNIYQPTSPSTITLSYQEWEKFQRKYMKKYYDNFKNGSIF